MKSPKEIGRFVHKADMVRAVIGMYRKFVLLVTMPLLLAEYSERETGEQYKVGSRAKVLLALRILRNTKKIPTLSHYLEHLYMATKMLKIPRSIDGCLVECGCFRGGSTANLSLACALTGRQLKVFASFEGLPDLNDQDTNTLVGGKSTRFLTDQYRGGLEEANSNVPRWREGSVCEFNAGYFDESLSWFTDGCVFVWRTSVASEAGLSSSMLIIRARGPFGDRVRSVEAIGANVLGTDMNNARVSQGGC